MKSKNYLVGACLIGASAVASSQNQNDTLANSIEKLQQEMSALKRIKITGYLQPQFQYIDSAGAASFAGGNFAPYTTNRFTMRRGRVKFTYEKGDALYVLNTDWTEKGVNMREAYVKLTDPLYHFVSLSLGLRQVQFGHDVVYSSGERETPERARIFQILFPTERDLQALVTLQAPKTSRFNFLKLDIAVLNGSGVATEFDSHKDVSARISFTQSSKSEKVKIGGGVSFLTGGYRQNRKNEYDFGKNSGGNAAFILHADTGNYQAIAPRAYMGADFQISVDYPFGINTLRAEYIQGKQSGTATSSTSPNALPSSDIYHRKFNGASFYFIQNIGQTRHQVVVKYDWYDPNTQLKGTQIGLANTNTKTADIKFTTWGFGWNYHFDEHTKVTLYYDLVKNEKTSLVGYTSDLKDNVFTFRIQYKF
jgi:phosphate-selective porin